MSLDSWFELNEVIDTGRDHVLLLRGHTKADRKKVVLKCYVCAAYAENAEHFVRWDMLNYESKVYEHALKELEASGLFVPFVMNKRRNWSFHSWEDISAVGMGPGDEVLLTWSRRFTFKSVQDFNYGINIIVTEDGGKKSFVDSFPMTTIALSCFVVQMVGALEEMAKIGVVHGDLRWNNVLLPKRARYFHLKRKVLIDEQEDEYAVPVNNVVQIFDWDHAFFWAMPEHDRGRISETYHASYDTNMNDIYDKLAFLRLLHRYFPCKFMDESDVDTMQPAFYDYVYRDPVSGKPLSQISQKGIGEPTWPGISDMRRAINEALHKVYVTASRTIVAHRIYLNRQKFLLAVEGDNPEGMKAMLRYPFFLDLDKKGIEASASIVEQRLTHEPENTFYKGWLKVMVEGDAREGFEMMRFECNFSEKNMEDFKKLVMNHEY
jgi:hypothetical protein